MELFLLIVLFLGLIFATIQDIRKREISNWLNAVLFAVGIFYQLIFSLSIDSYVPFFVSILVSAGLFGFGWILYSFKSFGGGDVKLLGAIGPYLTVFAVPSGISAVLFLFALFVFGFLYSLVWSIVLVVRNPNNFAKCFKDVWKEQWKLTTLLLIFFVLLILVKPFEGVLVFSLLGIFLLISSLFLQSAEKKYFTKLVSARELEEGDWLVNSVKVGNKTINLKSEGLTVKDIALIRKYGKKVYIKYGVPFAPAFLLASTFMVYAVSSGLVQKILELVAFS